MDTALEPQSSITKPVSSKLESGPPLMNLRQFARHQIGSRLASEPDLVASFWAQIGAPEERPDLTVIYCSVRSLLRNFTLLEFVAGETLEELVKRSDPAACEREIPLFCRILDAFEGSGKNVAGEPVATAELELLDFGVGRASGSLTTKFHGAVLTGASGIVSEDVSGEYGGSRSQVIAALMELCSKLPGELPRTDAYGPVKLAGVAVCSLGAAKVALNEPAPTVATAEAPVKSDSVKTARKRAIPSLIAVVTAMLTLLTFYFVGGFLAKRTLPVDAGKLVLPRIAPDPEPPQGDAAPTPAPVQSHPAATKPAAAHATKAVRKPIPSVVLARGATPIRQTSLLYPAAAQKEHVTGVVEMQLTIAEDGSVQSPRVVSGDPLLRAGLTEEVSKWVYQPLRVNGKPVPMTTELVIRFNLN
jgi:outer membrane biosynthesis protein TonB